MKIASFAPVAGSVKIAILAKIASFANLVSVAGSVKIAILAKIVMVAKLVVDVKIARIIKSVLIYT